MSSSRCPFWLKMTLLVIVTVSTALFGRAFRPISPAGAQPSFSAGAKAGAIGLMVLWVAIIFLGRAIAYDVEVWGALSLHAS